jgi:IS605 OrfB family transposase
MILVYRYRVKSLNGLLNRQSRACNFVWNYCNDRQKDALRFGRPWLSGFDLNKLTTGSSKELGLHSGTVNAVCEQYARSRSQMKRGVGIDLGLKDFATLSTGEKIEAQRIYRGAEQALALAQRAHKKRRAKAIHAKIANRRNDFLHKLSDRIVRQFDYIAVGNVAAAGLAKTSMAKSVLDAGWSSFRRQLAYKAIKHGAWFEEVEESFTSQVCSNCGAMSDSRPKGIADLGIREWQCSVCGYTHDRDINAAINILRRGRATLAAGIPIL